MLCINKKKQPSLFFLSRSQLLSLNSHPSLSIALNSLNKWLFNEVLLQSLSISLNCRCFSYSVQIYAHLCSVLKGGFVMLGRRKPLPFSVSLRMNPKGYARFYFVFSIFQFFNFSIFQFFVCICWLYV